MNFGDEKLEVCEKIQVVISKGRFGIRVGPIGPFHPFCLPNVHDSLFHVWKKNFEREDLYERCLLFLCCLLLDFCSLFDTIRNRSGGQTQSAASGSSLGLYYQLF